MEFCVADSQDRFHGYAQTKTEAYQKIRDLSKKNLGVHFFIFKRIYEFVTPTDEQKADKELWH